MKEHGHVIFIVGRVKAGDIDQGVAQAIPKVLRVQRRLPIVQEIHRFTIFRCRFHILRGSCIGEIYEGEEGDEEQPDADGGGEA